MKKRILFYISWIFCIVLLYPGCTENEMLQFNEPQGINFARINTAGGVDFTNDDIAALSVTYDFTDRFDHVIKVNDVLGKIQGYPSVRDLKLALKINPVENYATPDIILNPSGYAVKAGDLLDTLLFQVNRPAKIDTTCKADIVFDYVSSDVIPGTTERQVFKVTVIDKYNAGWMAMKITAQDWDDYLRPYIGAPGPIKIKLLLKRANVKDLTKVLADFKKNPTTQTTAIRTYLENYNKDNPDIAPLRERDGSIVVFEP